MIDPMQRITPIWISLVLLAAMPSCVITPSCPDGLSAAQCANFGEHEYVRTYSYFNDCESGPGAIPGLSTFTWSFTQETAGMEWPGEFVDSPPVREEYVLTGQNHYTRSDAAYTGPCRKLSISEGGFVLHCTKDELQAACYDVVYSLQK